MGRKKDFGLGGLKTDRRSLKETTRMERKKDFGPIGMKRERLLKLKHINWDEEGYVIKIETYKDGKLVK
jgi:hypothetical protein